MPVFLFAYLRKMKKSLLLIPILFGFLVSTAQSLNDTEQKIAKQIDADLPYHLELLKNAVNINSGTYNKTGVRAVGKMFGDELRALGFTVEWIGLPDSLNRAGHLVAYRKGTKGKKLFLIGHLDTVFEPDMPANPFHMINDSTATGQGVNDMKGGDVIMIAALKALFKEGLLEDRTITVYMTGDEENAGKPNLVSRADFIQRAKLHDYALAFEASNGMNTAAPARRGASEWRLEVTGKQGHSSGVFGRNGFGAIYEATRIINEFRLKLSTEKYLTFNPGLFVGGTEVNYDTALQKGTVAGKTNIISPATVVVGDLRFISAEQKEKARANMRKIISSNNLPGSSAKIFFKDGIPSMFPTKGNEALVKKLSLVSIALGYGEIKAGDPMMRGAGDVSYVAEYLDCMDGLGAWGAGEHAPGETTNIKALPLLAKRAAIYLYRLSHE